MRVLYYSTAYQCAILKIVYDIDSRLPKIQVWFDLKHGGQQAQHRCGFPKHSVVTVDVILSVTGDVIH